MYQVDFSCTGWVHFTGIGGISMSGIAELLLAKGFRVSGSDTKSSTITEHLEALGASISYRQTADNISPDMELLVYTAAVKQDNPELVAAKELGIPTLTRAEFLGQIMRNYKTAIGVSGTHGKTTTTSILSEILLEAETDPTISVGGILKDIHGNMRIGHSDLFITEACEYTNSFLSFAPTTAIILNVMADHLDFFKDLDDIRHSFREFARLVPDDGTLIINSGIPDLSYFTDGLTCKIITFGLDPDVSDYCAVNISYDEMGCACFDLLVKGENMGSFHLNTLGEHTILDTLAAIAAAMDLGIGLPTIHKGLSSFHNADRRFQIKGKLHGVTIVDDYAHHPDEIRATLTAAQKYPHREIWCVFQPHTYTRTKALLPEFAESLALADHVVLTDIYAAREKNTLGISSQCIVDEMRKYDCDVHYFPSFGAVEKFLLENCISGDLLITMGAGDVVLIGENLLGI